MKAKGKANFLKSGSAPSKSSKYLYYEQMKFLDKVQQRPTTSNFEPDAATEYDHASDNWDTTRDSNEDDTCDETSVRQDAARREFSNFDRNSGRKKQKVYDFGENLLTLLKSSKETEDDADRSFLVSLLPHVKGFDEEQKLMFQSEVLQLIMKIKRGKYAPITPMDTSYQNVYHVSYPQYHAYQPRPSQMMYSHPNNSSQSVSDPGPSQMMYNHPQKSSACVSDPDPSH